MGWSRAEQSREQEEVEDGKKEEIISQRDKGVQTNMGNFGRPWTAICRRTVREKIELLVFIGSFSWLSR